jgi:ATP-binding cassette subfamily B protein
MASTELPPLLKHFISERFSKESLHYWAMSDIAFNGDFGVQWLVATDATLCVIAEENGAYRIASSMPLSVINKIELAPHVGSESLEIETAGGRMRIIAYSNAQKDHFAALVKQLTAMIFHHDSARNYENRPTEIPPEINGHNNNSRLRKTFGRYIEKTKILVKVFKFALPYKKTLLALFLIMVAGTGFGLIGPYLSKLFIDVVFKPNPASGLYENGKWFFAVMSVMFVANTAQVALSGVQQRISGAAGYKMLHDVRVELYEKLQYLSLSFYDKQQTGGLISRVNQDTAELQRLMVDFFPVTLESLFMLAGVGVFLFLLSWQLTCVILIPLALVIALLKNIFPKIKGYFNRFFHRRSLVSALVNDTISGIRVVKVFGQEQREIGRFKSNSILFRDAGIEMTNKWSIYYPAFSFLMMLGAALVWLVGGEFVFLNKMTLGSVVAFTGYVTMFYHPAIALSQMAGTLANALSAAERVFEVIDAIPEITDAPDAIAFPVMKGAMELRGVTFGYDKNNPVIRSMDLCIKPCQRIALVGKSGAGKSTAAQLLCRLYDVDAGAIMIDGVNIKNIRIADLHKHIGVVPQETFLFNGTIFDNIAYARPAASKEEVIDAAKAAFAHEFIAQKPDAYDTIVGERGDRLSGGEKQRIALARALLHNPAILILDEATSSVDTYTEKKIKAALDNASKNRTVIGIAHRLSTLENYDLLCMIESGEIVETGTYEKLMEKKGRFYDLVNAGPLSPALETGGTS